MSPQQPSTSDHSGANATLDRPRIAGGSERKFVWVRCHQADIELVTRTDSCNMNQGGPSAAIADTLFEAMQHAQFTLDSIGDAVVTTDVAGCITYLNAAAEHMTGWSRELALGQSLDQVLRIVDIITRQAVPNPMSIAIDQDTVVSLVSNCVLIRRDGVEVDIEDSAAAIHDRSGKVAGAVMVFRDVTAARTHSAQLSHQARHDSLTDLPNRMLFSDRLTQAITLATRSQQHLAVLFVDMDRFKHINDSFGHAIGDAALQIVAQRLSTCVRSSDTVSRHGGDEFVILLSEMTPTYNAGITAEKILAALQLPCSIEGHDLHFSASIGIAIYPQDGVEAEMLMKHADLSMYLAKQNGRNNYQFFKTALNERALERATLENELHHALQRNELVLHYQPQMNLQTGAIIGAEALMRWQHPQRGLISPSQFIPIAEESGAIVAIGRWMLREACRQVCQWRRAGLPALRIAINVSSVELRSNHFVTGVRDALIATGVDPHHLELELTETFLLQDAAATAAVLNSLKALGMHLALDDFGTGYSSLSHLRSFPIDTLKIDQSFVHKLMSNADDASIVSAVISMGNSLHMRVVAEGIETQAQLEFLKMHGCAAGQGLLFGQSVNADEFSRLLRSSMTASNGRARAYQAYYAAGTADMFQASAEL